MANPSSTPPYKLIYPLDAAQVEGIDEQFDILFRNLNQTDGRFPIPSVIGDILYADTTKTFALLADKALGNVLISGGVGAAPSWGKIDLTLAIVGILPAANFPALTGDVTTVAGALATTLATVNANIGSFGSSTSIPSFTVNAKGLVTAASGNVVIAPAGTLTGTTLAANVVTSSLTTVGSLLSLTVDSPTFFVDAVNHRVGIGTITPQTSIHVIGTEMRYDISNAAAIPVPATGSATVIRVNNLDPTDNNTAGFKFNSVDTGATTHTFTAVETVYKSHTIGAWSGHLTFSTSTAGLAGERMRIDDTGRVGIGVTTLTAVLHLMAGTTVANTAPLKFTSGSLLTTAEAGAVEFLTDKFYGTITTGAARKTFAFLESPVLVTPTLGVASITSLNFGSTVLTIDTADNLSLRDGVNAQGIYLYGSFTDASNYIRLAILQGSNDAVIQAQNAGTGASRHLALGAINTGEVQFRTQGTKRWVVDTNGHFVASGGDNTLDIGASGANRPRSLYVGTSIGVKVAPTAELHLGAGTATANTAPLKFTSGTVLTTAEAGALEFTTDDFFATITTGAARKAFILDNGSRLTSGKIPVATTNGRLIDSTAATQIAAGISSIVASTFEKAETGTDANVLTYTTGGTDEFLIVAVSTDVSAITGTSIVVTVTWKDSNNATATSTLTLTAVGDGTINVPINAFTATNVVVSTVFVGVSTAYNISAFIVRLK